MRITCGFVALVLFGACSTTADVDAGERGAGLSINASAPVLSELCQRELTKEAGENRVHVAPTTRQIINGDVLVAFKVAEERQTVPADFEKAEAVARELNSKFHPERLVLPHKSRCAFTVTEPADALDVRLELSQPFANPYSSDDVISFVALLSLEQQAKVWYLIEARRRGNAWVVEKVIRLPIDE